MTAERFAAYRELQRILASLPLRDAEREVLRDAAEGHLLAAGADSRELIELALAAAIVLDRAVDSHRLGRPAADRVTAAIEAAGPDAAALLAA